MQLKNDSGKKYCVCVYVGKERLHKLIKQMEVKH